MVGPSPRCLGELASERPPGERPILTIAPCLVPCPGPQEIGYGRRLRLKRRQSSANFTGRELTVTPHHSFIFPANPAPAGERFLQNIYTRIAPLSIYWSRSRSQRESRSRLFGC